MKLHGQSISKPDPTKIILPRTINGEETAIIFQAVAVIDYDEFDKFCPEPKPPVLSFPGGKPDKVDYEDADYLKAVDAHGTRRSDWLILQSLQATDGLEWETVDFKNPATWENWRSELREAGFTLGEINDIVQGVMEANGFSEEKRRQARARFTTAALERAAT